jgi:hypothetical protein
MSTQKYLHRGLIILMTSSFLYGCGDNQPKEKQTIKKEIKRFKQATTLKGLVTDDKGRVKQGELKVTNAKKQVIATTTIQDDGHYKIDIPAATSLPILLNVSFQSNGGKTEELAAAVVYTSMTKFDINSLSTKIAKKAKALGGYTHTNMILAAESMVDIPDDNKTTRGFRGDPTKQYGGWH